jgi:hypothetical protein
MNDLAPRLARTSRRRSDRRPLSSLEQRGWDMTALVPERAVIDASVVLDGELVVFGSDGKPSQPRLCRRILAGDRSVPIVFVAFDVPARSTTEPYRERRRRLEALDLCLPDVHVTGARYRDEAFECGRALPPPCGKLAKLPLSPATRRGLVWKVACNSVESIDGTLSAIHLRLNRVGTFTIRIDGTSYRPDASSRAASAERVGNRAADRSRRRHSAAPPTWRSITAARVRGAPGR